MRSRLPVLRMRRRYLTFELMGEGDIEAKDLINEIKSSQSSLFGDSGTARNRIKMIFFDGRFGILRCHHASIWEARAILASIYSIRGIRVLLRTKGVSGSIKTATEKYIPRLSLSNAENDGRRVELEEVSGWIIHNRGREIDLSPDDKDKTKGSDTRYLGLTSFDLCGGCYYADGTANGIRQGNNGI